MNSSGWSIRAALVVALALLAPLPAISGALGPIVEQAGSPQDAAAKLAGLIKADAFLEAAKLADGLLARGPLAPETEAICGLAVLKAGRVDAAEAILKRVEARSPGLPDTALGLGRIARIRNDSTAALALFRKAAESDSFFAEACRQLMRTAMDLGAVAEIEDVRSLVVARFRKAGEPEPGWLTNWYRQLEGYAGAGLYRLEAAPEHATIPLLPHEERTIRAFAMRLNGRGEYPMDIDSASADFLTISPLLAEELGLSPTGSASASGVGSGNAGVRFARLDRVEFGGVVFRDVPVMVSDLHVFRGLRKGLLGTALLKRFNVTIDVRAETVELFALDRPELLTGRIDKARVAVEVPLLLFDATMVAASLEGAPESLYILDSAAATNLIDTPYFGAHIKPRLDPARVIAAGIQGATGVQSVNQVNGLKARLGSLALEGLQFNEFSMSVLNMIGGRYAAGLLGNPILWPYRSHYDFKNGKLILERYK